MAEDVGRAKAIALTNAMDHEIAVVHCVSFGEGGQMLVFVDVAVVDFVQVCEKDIVGCSFGVGEQIIGRLVAFTITVVFGRAEVDIHWSGNASCGC